MKDFDTWNTEKKAISIARGTAFFHEREIWWCKLGLNVGYEQDGNSEFFTRPVVILTKFNLDACLIVPLTARPKKGRYYFSIGTVEGRDAVAVLSQIRFVDRKRFTSKIETLDVATFNALSQTIVRMCFPALRL